MDIRSSVLKMIDSVPGTWQVAAAHLGMTYNVLRNRVYETKGWSLSTNDKLALQELSETTFFVEALAAASGGTFVKLPEIGQIANDSVQVVFNEMYAELGEHFKLFMKCIEDGTINSAERKSLEDHGADLHRKVEQMQALMFTIYCRQTNTVKLETARKVANG